jgi:ABC-type sugar transport system permease subunit
LSPKRHLAFTGLSSGTAITRREGGNNGRHGSDEQIGKAAGAAARFPATSPVDAARLRLAGPFADAADAVHLLAGRSGLLAIIAQPAEGRRPQGFVGLANFAALFADAAFRKALANNLLYAVGTVIPSLVLALGFAMALVRSSRINALFRSLFFLPVLIPLVAAASVFLFIFLPNAGLLDYHLAKLAISGPNWLGDPDIALYSIMGLTIWKNAGYYMLFFLAGLQAVPADAYEAAILDGANPWQRLRYVTLPYIKPTIGFVLVIGLINVVTQVDHVFVLTKGGPSDSTTCCCSTSTSRRSRAMMPVALPPARSSCWRCSSSSPQARSARSSAPSGSAPMIEASTGVANREITPKLGYAATCCWRRSGWCRFSGCWSPPSTRTPMAARAWPRWCRPICRRSATSPKPGPRPIFRATASTPRSSASASWPCRSSHHAGGYAFARIDFPGRTLCFYLFLLQLMLAPVVLIVPNLATIARLGLYDSLLGVMAPYFASAFGTFLMRQAFLAIPRELEDAALIDGASVWQRIGFIYLPLAKPSLIAFSIVSVTSHWNEFLWR